MLIEHASATRAHAARLAMWIFLASETLVFAALFALYASARVEHPDVFATGVAHAEKAIGTFNTGVLLTSSLLVACALEAARAGKRAGTLLLILATIACGLVFLGAKAVEITLHVRRGEVPAGSLFFVLYTWMIGLHAAHVLVGVTLLAVAAWWAARRRAVALTVFENVTLYWHFVDVVWLFLWPIFYLVGARGAS